MQTKMRKEKREKKREREREQKLETDSFKTNAFDLWTRVDVVLSFSDWVMVAGWQLLSRPPWFVAFVKSPPLLLLLRLPSNSAAMLRGSSFLLLLTVTAASSWWLSSFCLRWPYLSKDTNGCCAVSNILERRHLGEQKLESNLVFWCPDPKRTERLRSFAFDSNSFQSECGFVRV